MPMTVITLVNAPPSLRGDLSKWMQEIATGVYVGNISKRIRENLWDRVLQNIGKGEATLSYRCRNELGYQFETHKSKRYNIDYEGIPLVCFPRTNNDGSNFLKAGFSHAATYQKAKKYSAIEQGNNRLDGNYVVLDIETTGLDKGIDRIIEIGIIKVKNFQKEEFSVLIKNDITLPKNIVKLTGITDAMLRNDGVEEEKALEETTEIIGGLPIVGYAIDFDVGFINHALEKIGKPKLNNRKLDLLYYVKKEKMFLSNYHLETVLSTYGINEKVPHRALEDVRLIEALMSKVKGFMKKI